MLDIVACTVAQDRHLGGAGIDDPVLGNLRAGVVATLLHDVAFQLIGADDLHHQIRPGPDPVAAPRIGGGPHQQQIRFAERPVRYTGHAE